jgi:hypothetical protein
MTRWLNSKIASQIPARSRPMAPPTTSQTTNTNAAPPTLPVRAGVSGFGWFAAELAMEFGCV